MPSASSAVAFEVPWGAFPVEVSSAVVDESPLETVARHVLTGVALPVCSGKSIEDSGRELHA